ncbi:unnamed protein product [Urochloa decumbens]|uniref:Helicase C-terminal domain-containing protein n=1 Tax=Urochloa decumbens TaxID=240449 RepID=A0ABC9EJF3_9POAL
MLEKEIFYHHCVLITSNVSNLDLDTVKVELQKLWNLSCAWVLRRECSKSFLASFSSQGDVARCLNNPSTETLILNEEEVKLTVTRWTEDDDESNDLIQQWFLVRGVPRKYRAWMELYQVASAFGVLIDVDEGSLEVGDKEPIRLKIALSNQCGARFSYHYVVGWSSRMVMLTVEATIDSENNNHSTKIVTSTTSTHVLDFGDSSNKEHRKEQNAEQSLLLEEPTCSEESRLGGKTKENQISTPADKVHTSKKTTIESSKAEGLQPVCRNSTTINREDGFKGIQKPPIKHVFKRRGKKQQVTNDEAINKSPSNKLDKGVSPESGKAKMIEAPINSVEKKMSEQSSKTDRAQFKNTTTIMIEDRFKGENHDFFRFYPNKHLGECECMEQPEGMHLTLERPKGHISSQVPESMDMKKKVVPEKEPCGKIRCFACYETSHSLDQCRIKYKLVTVAQQFGYATKFPFIMIQPSEQMLENEKFYHHCVLITSSVSNLDLDIVKGELQKLWDLFGGWVLRRECSKSFLASFSSKDHVIRCLKKPSIQTLLDDEEVELTVTRWTECDDESNDLIKQWFLVCGVPRKYRAWVELYQVVSAFGLLIDVDEGSLEVGDEEPIRLKIALRNHDGSSLSYHYVFGLSSRIVEAKVDTDNSSHTKRIVTSTGTHVLDLDFGNLSDKKHEKELNMAQSMSLEEPTCIGESIDGKTKENQISSPAATVNDSKTTTESSKPEGVQMHSICRNSTRMIGEDRFQVIVPRDEELEGIRQFYIKVEEETKLSKLYAVLKTRKVTKLIMFVNTKDKVMSLAEEFGKHYTVSASHEGMDQHARDTVIQKFQSGPSSILITTDLQLQGTNAVQVPTVINYDLPTQLMQYICRIQQQNGQPGRKSLVINLVTRADEHVLFEIQRFCNGQVVNLSDI